MCVLNIFHIQIHLKYDSKCKIYLKYYEPDHCAGPRPFQIWHVLYVVLVRLKGVTSQGKGAKHSFETNRSLLAENRELGHDFTQEVQCRQT